MKSKLDELIEDIKLINERINDLEKFHKDMSIGTTDYLQKSIIKEFFNILDEKTSKYILAMPSTESPANVFIIIPKEKWEKLREALK